MKNDGGWITGNITLTLGGEPLNMQMTVPAKPVKPIPIVADFAEDDQHFC